MRIIFTLLLCFVFHSALSMENIFYILHDDKKEALAAIEKHPNLINTLIIQAYHIDQNGHISGHMDEEILSLSRKYSIKVIAMVTNTLFDSYNIHQFLSNPNAQQNTLQTLIDQCKEAHVAGVQFDFEMVPLKDKQALTQFYQMAADALHKNGFIVSFAIAPTLADDHFKSLYQKKLYQVWQGAYDCQKLGELSDFVTIMSYDQHGTGTTPGPIASIPWSEQVIQHALLTIPADKISFGIPTYSGLWYMNIDPASYKTSINYDFVTYNTLNYILNKFKPNVKWDETSQVHYTFFEWNGINRILFIEDGQSFKAKFALAKKYQLRGISVFKLGIEDSAIWDQLLDQPEKPKHKPWWAFWL